MRATGTGQQRGAPDSISIPDETWIDRECAQCTFTDVRLEKRFRKLVEQLSGRMGESIPLACQDWANTKAAYRFFSNDRVSEEDILRGHFQSTRDRFAAAEGPVLILHDTSEFTYKRDAGSSVGIIGRPAYAKCNEGLPDRHTIRGILMHSSLALTKEGLPLGLASIKFWTRSQFKGCNALKRRINPTRIPIEEKESFRWLENLRQSTRLLDDPGRCVHIGDRESDIFELFCAAAEEKTHFLFRTCADRFAGERGLTVAKEMETPDGKGMRRLQLKTKDGKPSEALVEIKYRRLRVLPPEGKRKQYPALELTVIHITEESKPENRDPVKWKLLTNLPVKSMKDAAEKMNWYAMRWKIETFHKVLKSGCKAQEARLQTSERLVRLVSVLCIVGWRVFWLTMNNRCSPEAPAGQVVTPLECEILDHLVPGTGARDSPGGSVSHYLTKIARLGGYLARTGDPPPGNMVMWRGLSRLNDIQMGVLIGAKLVCN